MVEAGKTWGEKDQFEERPRSQDDIKTCLRDVGWKGVACIHLG